MQTLYRILQEFALVYPLFMAYLWIVGGIYYFFHWERRGRQRVAEPPTLVGTLTANSIRRRRRRPT